MVSSSGDTLLEARTVVVNELMLLLLSELLSSLRTGVAGAVDAMDGYDTGWAWTPEREHWLYEYYSTLHTAAVNRTNEDRRGGVFFFWPRGRHTSVMASAGGVMACAEPIENFPRRSLLRSFANHCLSRARNVPNPGTHYPKVLHNAPSEH